MISVPLGVFVLENDPALDDGLVDIGVWQVAGKFELVVGKDGFIFELVEGLFFEVLQDDLNEPTPSLVEVVAIIAEDERVGLLDRVNTSDSLEKHCKLPVEVHIY